jgi:CubicO group peptidase (beta-lactamase class C family)
MVGRVLVYNDPKINDLKAMPHREVKAGEKYLIPHAVSYNTKSLPDSLNVYLKKTKTVAFLVIKHDSLLYEWYEKGYSDSSYTNPFSATKSVVGILTGAALKEGKIKSLDEPVANYLPEYRDSARSQITITHLLTMSSGLNYYDQALNPFGGVSQIYYGRNVRKFINKLKVEKVPGSSWRYKNADTEILSIAVANAVGKKLSDYASEKLWQPMGAERDAKWIIDDQPNAIEKAYCCLYTNAHDLAKVGMLYEHFGNTHGTQVVDSSYVKAAIQPVNIPNEEKDGKPQNHYGYSWWTQNVDNDFHMDGMRGQYVIVLPKEDMIVVRLGKKDWYKASKRFKPETPNFYALIIRKVRETFGN